MNINNYINMNQNRRMSFLTIVCLAIYYGFAQHLPCSFTPIVGKLSKRIRFSLCRHIFRKCGKNVNIERHACFGSGRNLEVGNNSGLGLNCTVPSNIVIGDNVMMGPNVYIFENNHRYDRIDIPMNQQGHTEKKRVVVGDDVWIGAFVKILPGRTIKKGSIIAAGTVLVKDFPEYSIVGGNPSKFIKSRIQDDKD